MKKFIIATIFTMSSGLAFATDYFACEPSYGSCTEEASCSSFYLCQQEKQLEVNLLVLKATRKADFDKRDLCVQKRSDLEGSIEAHATTIECHDTIDGPVFGG